jgi:purine-cytosine permease-like protein
MDTAHIDCFTDHNPVDLRWPEQLSFTITTMVETTGEPYFILDSVIVVLLSVLLQQISTHVNTCSSSYISFLSCFFMHRSSDLLWAVIWDFGIVLFIAQGQQVKAQVETTEEKDRFMCSKASLHT